MLSSILKDTPPAVTVRQSGDAIGAGSHHQALPGEGPGAPLPDRGGPAERAGGIEAGPGFGRVGRERHRESARATAGRERLRRGIFAGAAAIVLGVVVWLLPRIDGGRGLRLQIDRVPVATAFTQLTTEPGLDEFPSLSPDGKWIVYDGNQAGNADIYLQSVGGHNAINLTKDSPEDDTQPAFSPDGESIAFRSEREGGGIFVMGRTGESVRRLTDGGYNPAWSPDATKIVYATDSRRSRHRSGSQARQRALDRRCRDWGEATNFQRRCCPTELVSARTAHRVLGGVRSTE